MQQKSLDFMDLSHRLDHLHRLLYRRGGIRPSNAAIEELTKLLFLRIATMREPLTPVDSGSTFATISPKALGKESGVHLAKAAFSVANSLPGLRAQMSNGLTQPIWPADEPLRITRNDILQEAASILWDLPVGNGAGCDALGTAFDVFLRRRYDNSGGLGSYLTPGPVVDMMVQIGFRLALEDRGEITPSDLFGDPCCGSGRFLIGMWNALQEHNPGNEVDCFESHLLGADQSPSSVAMARVNLLAAGLKSPQVFVVDDSITDSWMSTSRGQFRLILTNPPFGEKQYDSTVGIQQTSEVLWQLKALRRIDPALAFVARCIELLAPRGVLGIILPDGIVNGAILQDLILGPSSTVPVNLEGVVSLPSATFAPAGTTAKTSVLFLRKDITDIDKHVFLSRADHVGYVMSKGSPVPDKLGDDLPLITEEVLTLLESNRHDPGDLKYIAVERIRNMTSLDASSIDHNAKTASRLLLTKGGFEAGNILQCAGKNRSPVTPGQPFVSVLHVDDIGVIDWDAAKDYRPSTPGQTALPGQLIVSLLNPQKFRAAVVPSRYPSIQCSIEFGVFDSQIDPYVALALLQHPLVRQQIAPLGRGTSSSRRRINANDIHTLLLPRYSTPWSDRVGSEARSYFEHIDLSRQGLKQLYTESNESCL